MVPAKALFLASVLLLLALPLLAQDAKPDFEKLWVDGTLWEVGDNREIVRVARKALVESGDEGRKFLLTKLNVSDSLQTRCLNEVFIAWGAKAYDDLIANVGHTDPVARRNVADLLAALNDARAAETLLAQASKEEVLSPRVSQLAALAKWKIEAAIPLIAEVSRDKAARVRHRAAGLLGVYEAESAVNRLIEMLEDETYYVRDGAAAALMAGSQASRAICFEHARAQFQLPPAEQKLQCLRLLLPVIATVADAGVPELLRAALKHESGAIRGEAANALVTWKLGAGLLEEQVKVDASLTDAANAEYDPYAKAAIEQARKRLADGGKK